MRTLVLLAISLLAVAFATTEKVGSFIVDTTKDELTDEIRIVAFTPATMYPDYANDAALILRCIGEEFNIIIYADKFLNSSGDEVPIW